MAENENNILKVSQYLIDDNSKNNAPLTCVDIVISNDYLDEERFLDLYTILHLKTADFGYKYKERILKKIETLFTEILNAIINDNNEHLDYLSNYLGEAKYIKLGYSKSSPGTGLGKKKFYNLIKSIKSSNAFKDGAIEHLLDTELYISGIAEDIISDLIANAIQDVLSEYTEDVVNSYIKGNEIREIETHYWNELTIEWDIKTLPMLNYKKDITSEKEYNYLLVPNSFTCGTNQKSYIIHSIFKDYIFDIFQSKILNNPVKYSTYYEHLTPKNTIPYRWVLEFIKNELGIDSDITTNSSLTCYGLLSLVKAYPDIKEYIDGTIKS